MTIYRKDNDRNKVREAIKAGRVFEQKREATEDKGGINCIKKPDIHEDGRKTDEDTKMITEGTSRKQTCGEDQVNQENM